MSLVKATLFALLLLVPILPALPVVAAEGTNSPTTADGSNAKTWLDVVKEDVKQPSTAPAGQVEAVAAKEAPAPSDPPPLPFHTIEGYGGGAITPIAYLVNPGPKDKIFGLPSIAFANVIAGKKNLQSLSIVETLFGRVEFSYAAERFGLGDLPGAIKRATTVDVGRTDVYLHNVNVRALLLEENSFGTKWLPAITAGVHFKVNDGIGQINHRLGGALNTIGYDDPWGIEYTLTASKMFCGGWTFNRPLIVSAGLRNSNASNLGFTGFGGPNHTTFEGNVVYLPTDWLLIAYEYRQKARHFSEIHGLVNSESDWHSIDVSWLINSHATLTAGWGILGNLANTTENGAWWLQFKYEF